MNRLALVFCLALTATGRSQDFRVISHPDHAEVVSVKYGYRFQAPVRWYVSETNPAPYAFSYPPSQMRFAQVGVPKTGADLAIIADKDAYRSGSIVNWIQIEKERAGFSSVEDLGTQLNPLIPRTVEVVSYEDMGDRDREMVIHVSSVYFEFGGQAFRATLRFNANDLKAREYEKCLRDVLRSFQKVSDVGSTGSK